MHITTKFVADDTRTKREIIRKIADNAKAISKRSQEIESMAGTISQLTMVNDWYLQENVIQMQEIGLQAETTHLTDVYAFYEKYLTLLNELHVLMRNTVEIVSSQFDYEDEDIQDTISRIQEWM